MATSNKSTVKKWIDLKDPAGAMLKVGVYRQKLVLVLTGIRPRSSTFHRVINEMGYTPSKSGAYLVRAVELTDKVLASHFQKIWPNAGISEMKVDQFRLDLEAVSQKANKKLENKQAPVNSEEPTMEESITEILNRSTYLGRNRQGDRVFHSASGRFYVDDEAEKIINENNQLAAPLFLRGNTQTEVRECAKGLLRACEKGESQNKAALMRFAGSVLQKEPEVISESELEVIAQAIDSAILEALVENSSTAGQAWADAAYYQEMMPGRAAFVPDSNTTPFLPVPIAVQIQRFLSGAFTVSVSGRIPGYGFGLLPESTQVFVEDNETLDWSNHAYHRPVVDAAEAQDVPAEASYWRISGIPTQETIEQHFANLSNTAVSVITAGSTDVLPMLQAHAGIVQSIKVPNWLSGTEKPIYVFVMKNGESAGQSENVEDRRIPQVTSWNDLKTLVDETLLRLGKVEEANEVVQESQRTENRYQRPYIAFSKTGQASTMVPKNLQSALGFALSRLEEVHGPVDTFVADELGIGSETLVNNFSPEQIDATGLAINRILTGRGFILGDETGIGKGRTIAATATWANKLNKRVIFITDRSNLFSDLARDLIDIGEWERFRPLITNTDGKILNIMGDAEEIAQPLSPTEMKRIMEGDPADVNANIIFTTYSQINNDESAKGQWLRDLCKDSLVICDEAHIAAGSDSNIARQVQDMVDNSWGVLYSSATWAKSSKNLHIYARALPESVNISQVVSAMKEDGESFGEIFSSMLAMDGAFIRREHDLSKIDFVVDPDTEYADRNTQVAGQVSEILGMMAMISGEINHMLQKMNASSRNALIDARSARDQINSEANEQQRLHDEYTARLEQERSRYTDLLQITNEDIERLENELALNPGAETEGRDSLQVLIARREQLTLNITAIDNQIAQSEVPANPTIAPKKANLFSSSFGTGSAIYQVMRRTLAALSIDHTADKAIRAVHEGRRPVIVLEETGESFVRQCINDEIERIKNEIAALRQREAEGTLTENDRATREIADLLDAGAKHSDIIRQIRIPTLRDMMNGLLTRLGGIKVMEGEFVDGQTDEDGFLSTTLVANSNLQDIPGVSGDLVDRYMKGIEEIAAKISNLPQMPIIPIDALRNKFAKANISMGEISGRHYELHPVEGTEWTVDGPSFGELKKRARKKSDVTQTVKAFNSGRIDALAINKSAATGLSIHSSPRFEDSRQREMFEMQSDENPTNRIQLFGRVNRFDQVVPPRISMMTTGLKGEMRTIMMQNKKLTSLSANIRSSRENAALIEDVPDLLNKTGDKVCQEYLLENPGIAGRLDIPMSRLNVPFGIAQLMTQRIALLSPRDQDKVYNDLSVSYDDAMQENKLALDSDTILTRNWRAKTISQSIAWGPVEHTDALSAFDSPVFQRQVEFTQNYQPLHWDEIRDKIAESSQRLMEDDRVKPQHILSVSPINHDHIFQSHVDRELGLPIEDKREFWAYGILNSMVMSLPAESLGENFAEADLVDDIDEDTEEEAASDAAEQIPAPKLNTVPKGFESLGNHWVAVETRQPGTRLANRLMALISRSGKTAKLWFLDETGGARQFLLNLEKAVADHENGVSAHLKEMEPLTGLGKDSWQRKRFNNVWGSIDQGVALIDFSACTDKAAQVMEAKKVIAFQQTGFDSIEQAMSHGEHNAVKEASFRQAFIQKVLPNLTPGTQFWISPRESNQRFGNFFNSRRLVVTDVKIPAPGHESVLSRWKFNVVSPGEEKATTLSGALLFKLAGLAPRFSLITVDGNLYSGMGNEIVRAAQTFGRYAKGEVVRRRTLLVGNMFQAGEWARDSKKGHPIIYTDEAGQGHRAIEVSDSLFGMHRIRFPQRLHNRQSIKDFFTGVMDSVNEEVNTLIREAFTVFSSFKGALIAQSRGTNVPDRMLIDPANNALGWLIDKGEKAKITRNLRNAVKADNKAWEVENPGVDYPVKYTTHSPRSSSNAQVQLSIKLPETREGRDRFFDIFIKTQGLQLFVTDQQQSPLRIAKDAERKYYARLAQPTIEERDRFQAIRERRKAMRTMLSNAFEDKGQERANAESFTDNSAIVVPEQASAPSLVQPVLQEVQSSTAPGAEVEQSVSEAPVQSAPSQIEEVDDAIVAVAPAPAVR